jgi:cob(I)alamin adenosyltransferase
MGKRLTTIATRTGDDGTTGLGDGSRVAKTDTRIVALGDVDELNTVIGLLLTEPLPEPVAALLLDVQHDLFDLGGELSIPGYTMVTERQVLMLDEALADFNADLPRLEEFILPGGSRAAAFAHLARTVCRRAERAVLVLSAEQAVNAFARQYLNRLSDLLFVLSRVLNRFAGRGDVQWQPRKNSDASGNPPSPEL